jgi:Ca2+-transporting ATPase
MFIKLFSNFFLFEKVDKAQIGLSVLVGFVSVMWIEIYKLFKRKM